MKFRISFSRIVSQISHNRLNKFSHKKNNYQMAKKDKTSTEKSKDVEKAPVTEEKKKEESKKTRTSIEPRKRAFYGALSKS